MRLYAAWLLLWIANEVYGQENRSAITCRTERGVKMDLEAYKNDTCARCYFYLPPWAFTDIRYKFRYNPKHLGILLDPRTNSTHHANPDDPSHPMLDTFQSEAFARKWVSCCRASLSCCDKMWSDSVSELESPFCPRTWDGWQCWPDTPSGQVAESPCQEHVYFMSEPPPCPRHAEKRCLSNGTWFISQEWKTEWSNYSGCGRVEGIRRLQYFHIATHTVSILFLLPAIAIFMTYKQLHVHRIVMHKHLFLSLLLNAVSIIVFKASVMLDELNHAGNRRTVLEENGVGCRLLFIFTKYLRSATYMWMFCEGFYLHKLIAAAFAEQKTLVMFYVIGWGEFTSYGQIS